MTCIRIGLSIIANDQISINGSTGTDHRAGGLTFLSAHASASSSNSSLDRADRPPSLASVRASCFNQKAMRAEKQQRIEAALLQLPESQQKAVRLRHLEGRKIEDVARILDKSPAATAQVIYRGIAALKRLLESDPL